MAGLSPIGSLLQLALLQLALLQLALLQLAFLQLASTVAVVAGRRIFAVPGSRSNTGAAVTASSTTRAGSLSVFILKYINFLKLAKIETNLMMMMAYIHTACKTM